MFLLVLSAFATDSGIQRVYDREVECAYEVDPQPDPSTCFTRVRSALPTDERPTWAISVAAPGKLYVSYHMPDIAWGTVHMLRTPRAFEPILLSVGLSSAPACDDERIGFAHLNSERGAVTHQSCTKPPWPSVSEVILDSHRKLPPQQWTPIWVNRPTDPSLATDVKNWFLVQVYVSMDGSRPERPERFPYPSVDMLLASVPKSLPPRRGRVVRLEVVEQTGTMTELDARE